MPNRKGREESNKMLKNKGLQCFFAGVSNAELSLWGKMFK
jgi:hypothetical protein